MEMHRAMQMCTDQLTARHNDRPTVQVGTLDLQGMSSNGQSVLSAVFLHYKWMLERAMHPLNYLQVQSVVRLRSIRGTLGLGRGREMEVAACGAAVRPDLLQRHFLAVPILIDGG